MIWTMHSNVKMPVKAYSAYPSTIFRWSVLAHSSSHNGLSAARNAQLAMMKNRMMLSNTGELASFRHAARSGFRGVSIQKVLLLRRNRRKLNPCLLAAPLATNLSNPSAPPVWLPLAAASCPSAAPSSSPSKVYACFRFGTFFFSKAAWS